MSEFGDFWFVFLEIHFVNLRIQSKCRKIRTRTTPNSNTFEIVLTRFEGLSNWIVFSWLCLPFLFKPWWESSCYYLMRKTLTFVRADLPFKIMNFMYIQSCDFTMLRQNCEKKGELGAKGYCIKGTELLHVCKGMR